MIQSLFLLSFLFLSVSGFGVGPLHQYHSRGATSSTTELNALPIDTQSSMEISNAAHSMWIATIDADIANIQLEEFRKVFAGGIVSDSWFDSFRTIVDEGRPQSFFRQFQILFAWAVSIVIINHTKISRCLVLTLFTCHDVVFFFLFFDTTKTYQISHNFWHRMG